MLLQQILEQFLQFLASNNIRLVENDEQEIPGELNDKEKEISISNFVHLKQGGNINAKL